MTSEDPREQLVAVGRMKDGVSLQLGGGSGGLGDRLEGALTCKADCHCLAWAAGTWAVVLFLRMGSLAVVLWARGAVRPHRSLGFSSVTQWLPRFLLTCQAQS